MPSVQDLLPGVPLIESPLFNTVIGQLELDPIERQVAVDLHERGYALIDFPDPHFNDRADRVIRNLLKRFPEEISDPNSVKGGRDLRLQDAWQSDSDVRAIAANERILDLLGKLYGRRAFPFQTLNFPVGTQQTAHSDAVHFSSQPERFMCGVWVALEDVAAEAGPLLYHPGSHAWPIISNAMIGRRGWGSRESSAQSPYEAVWAAMVAANGSTEELFTPRRGQALIWAANLLHGGSPMINPRLTRWSQVTHYFFENCLYYTPAFSDEALGLLDLRQVVDIASGEGVPNRLLGDTIEPSPVPRRGQPRRRFRWLKRPVTAPALPEDFDPDVYLALNPDVAAAGEDAAAHWQKHGLREGRRYR